MHFILTHGGWHGSWCWKYLTPYLEAAGYSVIAVDFPGYEDPASVRYETYYDHLESIILSRDEPVTLVAHSMSGVVAGPLAAAYPERISQAFFIGAYLPFEGVSLHDVAVGYDDSQMPLILYEDEKAGLYKLKNKEKAKEVLYHDCPPDIGDWALSKLRPQPSAPLKTAIHWPCMEAEKSWTYIVCEEDRDVSVRAQYDMAKYHGCEVISMPCGHFPFFSDPEALAHILMQKAPLVAG